MPDRSYLNDFLAGVDPTGTRTFQYGMEDAHAGESSGLRRGIGAVGGTLGGAAVVPGLVGGTVGGIKGLLMGKGNWKQRLLSGGTGFLGGAKKPYTSIYKSMRANKALAAHSSGKVLDPKQAKNLERYIHGQLPQSLSYGQKISPEVVQQTLKKLSPKQLSGVRRELGGEIGSGAAALGLSGLVSGGSAYMQYGKGGLTGDRLREAGMPMHKTSAAYNQGFNDMLKEAGLRSLAKYLLTGRSTLFHGTSGARAKSILQQGLKPNAKPGISERIKNVVGVDPRGKTPGVFATRNKGNAAGYSMQQELLDRGVPSGAEAAMQFQDAMQMGDFARGGKNYVKHIARQLRHTPSAILNRRTLKASVPAHKIRMEGNPEININPLAQSDIEKAVTRMNKRPLYFSDAKLPAIPPQYIKGSPSYKHVSMREMRDHFKRMRKQPGTSAKEALRNLFDAQGSPLDPRDIGAILRSLK